MRPVAVLTSVGLVCATAGLGGCGDAAALDRLAQGPRARVVSAPSGDQLVLADKTRVKLAGIEAPARAAPFAQAAQAVLARLAVGRRVELLFGGARGDPSGTATAQVRVVGGPWLEAALLDAGAARVGASRDDRALAGPMLAHEARARAAGRGLWAMPYYRVRLPDEVEPDEPSLVLVEGRVVRTGRTERGVYLDFARDWRSVASARIDREALRDFAAAGLEPETLEGRMVRLRGPVREEGGAPVLLLDHPEQVEPLDSR